jgi:hypothetical protein
MWGPIANRPQVNNLPHLPERGGAVSELYAFGSPGGQGQRDYQIVVFGGFRDVHQLSDYGFGFLKTLRYSEFSLFEEDLESGDQIAFGDVPGVAGFVFFLAAGDGYGGDFAAYAGGAEHVYNRGPEAGSVDYKGAAAGYGVVVGYAPDSFDNFWVGGSEGHSFEVADQDGAFFFGASFFNDGYGRRVSFLTEVESDVESDHGFSL